MAYTKLQSQKVTNHTHSSFCPKCGVDVSQFSHESHCPHA